jgi:hypothetical protein
MHAVDLAVLTGIEREADSPVADGGSARTRCAMAR